MFKLTRHGLWEMIIGTAVLALIGWGLGWLWWPLSILVVPVWLWLIAFFRDPDRPIPTEPNIMVSPADGTVSDVSSFESHDLMPEPGVRVGIFLSVFNVHVNRAPCDGKVVSLKYCKGKFLNALDHKRCSDENESNTIVLLDPASGQTVAVVKQIVGLIARRIICTLKTGDTVARGERFGMIKFGSRTELFVPKRLGPSVTVTVGQKVRGGGDVICRLGVFDKSDGGAAKANANAAVSNPAALAEARGL